MKKVFSRPEALKEVPFRFCPGCGHGILHRIVAEVVDEYGVRGKTIGIAPVGCAVFAYDYWNFDVIECAHGRPPAVATALKRLMPDRVVVSYQGDGDLASIGMAEIVHAANRGENFTVVFVNNANYGMTGGQMAPTTLAGQRTTTTPSGRDPSVHGHPMPVAEIMAQLPGTYFVCRTSLDSAKGVLQTKKAIKRAIGYQIEGRGFTFVEVLSPCPTDWGLSPEEALKWLKDPMAKTFRPGILKEPQGGEQ